MPFLTDKLALEDPFLDRRTRLLPCQRERTLLLREQDGLTYQAISDVMWVSKRLVYFVINPAKWADQKIKAALRQSDGRYYDKERHTTAVREHRRHKQGLLKAQPL